jgi:(p)ppGpp synthase/HD superfamily hydrolase
MTDLVNKARELAVRAHGDQKYGEQPYVVHLQAVAEILVPFGETARAIAYLHDVVEDTAVSTADVEDEFGHFVAECVGVLTDEPGVNRKERKARTYAKLAEVGPRLHLALVVKAADRLANIQACIADKRDSLLSTYRREHSAFRSAAYRPGLCDGLWREMELALAETGAPQNRR